MIDKERETTHMTNKQEKRNPRSGRGPELSYKYYTILCYTILYYTILYYTVPSGRGPEPPGFRPDRRAGFRPPDARDEHSNNMIRSNMI